MNLTVLKSNTIRIRSNSTDELEFLLNNMYKKTLISYPKFYKMNPLCKLSWLNVVELFNDDRGIVNWKNNDRLGTVFFNKSSSLVSDIAHMKAYRLGKNNSVSPSIFVYTLPNIVNGELAIYFGWNGYSNFLIADNNSLEEILYQVKLGFQAGYYDACLAGVIEISDGVGENYASLALLVPTETGNDEEEIKSIFLIKN